MPLIDCELTPYELANYDFDNPPTKPLPKRIPRLLHTMPHLTYDPDGEIITSGAKHIIPATRIWFDTFDNQELIKAGKEYFARKYSESKKKQETVPLPQPTTGFRVYEGQISERITENGRVTERHVNGRIIETK
jgi:hypothetical protein